MKAQEIMDDFLIC